MSRKWRVSWDGKTNSAFIGKYEGSKKSVYLDDIDYFNYQISSYGIYTYDWDGTEQKDNTGKQYKNGLLF